jgi:hypothetical protein
MDDEAALHAQVEGELHGLDGIVAAVGIAGVIGLAHAGHQMLDAAPVGERAGEGEEHQIASGHEGGREPALADLDRDLARERGVGELRQRVETDDVILAQPLGPGRTQRRHARAHAFARIELGTVALAIVEAHGLDAREALERPGQAHRRILSAGEQHEGGIGGDGVHDRPGFMRKGSRKSPPSWCVAPAKAGAIFQRLQNAALWVPAFAGTTIPQVSHASHWDSFPARLPGS